MTHSHPTDYARATSQGEAGGPIAKQSFHRWSTEWAKTIQSIGKAGIDGPMLSADGFRALADCLEGYIALRPQFAIDGAELFERSLAAAQRDYSGQFASAWGKGSLEMALQSSRALLGLAKALHGRLGVDAVQSAILRISEGQPERFKQALDALGPILATFRAAVDADPFLLTLEDRMGIAKSIVLAAIRHNHATSPWGAGESAAAKGFLLVARMNLPIDKNPIAESDLAWVRRQWADEARALSNKKPRSLDGSGAPPDLPIWENQIARHIHAMCPNKSESYAGVFLDRHKDAGFKQKNPPPLAERSAQRREAVRMASSALAAKKPAPTAPARRPGTSPIGFLSD